MQQFYVTACIGQPWALRLLPKLQSTAGNVTILVFERYTIADEWMYVDP